MAKTDLRQFDYKDVARSDAAMWRAYYNHRFLALFWDLFLTIKRQLGLNWFITFRLSYYSAWAAADYRLNKKRGIKTKRVLKNLTRFYGLISRHAIEPFDYQKAAALELEWWEIHRKSVKNNPRLESALAEAAGAIYNTDSAKLKDYAHYRAEAMILPRHEGDRQPVPTDWNKIDDLVNNSWKSLYDAVNN